MVKIFGENLRLKGREGGREGGRGRGEGRIESVYIDMCSIDSSLGMD